MERSKAAENLTEKDETEESKIPKSTRFSTASSKPSREKERTQNLKRTAKLDSITSSKGKQTQAANFTKNVRQISLAKISKDIMNDLKTEHLNFDDLTTECADPVMVPNNRSTIKRALLEKNCSQTTQKKPGNLSKKSSASDLKSSAAAFGGMRLNSKRNSCRKPNMFQNNARKTKQDHQAINTADKETAISTSKPKITDFAKAVVSKETEHLNEENLENLTTDEAKSSKVTSISMKEAVKKSSRFGGIRFTPNWQSTPLKPDFFESIKRESNNDDEDVIPINSSTKRLIDAPDSRKMIVRKKSETGTVDKAAQLATKEDYSNTASSILKEANYNICTAFEGMHLTPKRKSTFPPPDIFEKERKESKSDDQELQQPGSSAEQMKMPSTTKAVVKSEIPRSHVKKQEQLFVEKPKATETISITTNEISRATTYVDARLGPKLKRTSIRPNIIDSIQKESNIDDLVSHSTGSSREEIKKLPVTSRSIIKVETQHSEFKKLQTPANEKPESSEVDIEKAINEVIQNPYTAFGGLRFKPQQRNLRDVFKARKSKVNVQEKS